MTQTATAALSDLTPWIDIHTCAYSEYKECLPDISYLCMHLHTSFWSSDCCASWAALTCSRAAMSLLCWARRADSVSWWSDSSSFICRSNLRRRIDKCSAWSNHVFYFVVRALTHPPTHPHTHTHTHTHTHKMKLVSPPKLSPLHHHAALSSRCLLWFWGLQHLFHSSSGLHTVRGSQTGHELCCCVVAVGSGLRTYVHTLVVCEDWEGLSTP